VKFSVALALLVAVAFAVTPAHAKLHFGLREDTRFLQDVKVTGPNGEALYLAYKISTQNFLLGLYVEDDGYVLVVKNDQNRYYKMPTGDVLRSLQVRGLLPDPLPPYSINTLDYLVGYSLWLTIAVTVLLCIGQWLLKRRRGISH
jgi:hypothetical protein